MEKNNSLVCLLLILVVILLAFTDHAGWDTVSWSTVSLKLAKKNISNQASSTLVIIQSSAEKHNIKTNHSSSTPAASSNNKLNEKDKAIIVSASEANIIQRNESNFSHTRFNVCGNLLPSKYLWSRRDCFNRTREKFFSEPCAWPVKAYSPLIDEINNVTSPSTKQDLMQSLELEKYKYAPIPASSRFHNFSVDEARSLLRGKTIVFDGDSTQRRLMWALCRFINGISVVPGDNCCGTKRITFWCNYPNVTRSDILIGYTGATKTTDQNKWYKTKLPDILRWRRKPFLKGGTNIKEDDMPPSKVGKSIHIFKQFLTWHMKYECYLPVKDLFNYTNGDSQSQKCGFGDYFHDKGIIGIARNATENSFVESTCAIAAEFYSRFTRSVTSQPTPVYGHGLTNVPASKSKHGLLYSNYNWWQKEMAKSVYSLQVGSKRCKKYSIYLQKEMLSKKNITCDFTDQTTFLLDEQYSMTNTIRNNPSRQRCFVGEKWQGIHVYNEQAQLMRVQNILNSILHSEQKQDSDFKQSPGNE